MIDIVEFKKWCNYNRDAKLDEVMGDIFVTVDALAAEIAAMKQQEPVASIYISGGSREFDDWKCDLPVGRNLLFTSPVAKGEEK